jgi:hypothetical protein
MPFIALNGLIVLVIVSLEVLRPNDWTQFAIGKAAAVAVATVRERHWGQTLGERAVMPERIRSGISSRSNSAMPASTVAIIRPCSVKRSNAMPFSATRGTRRASNSRKIASRSVVLRP